MACPAENELYVAEILNWRVQKLLLHPTKANTSTNQSRGGAGLRCAAGYSFTCSGVPNLASGIGTFTCRSLISMESRPSSHAKVKR